MEHMFSDAKSFNQDLSYWDVSAVSHMALMFLGASAFKRKLCGIAWVKSKAKKRGIFMDSPGSISSKVCTTTRTGNSEGQGYGYVGCGASSPTSCVCVCVCVCVCTPTGYMACDVLIIKSLMALSLVECMGVCVCVCVCVCLFGVRVRFS